MEREIARASSASGRGLLSPLEKRGPAGKTVKTAGWVVLTLCAALIVAPLLFLLLSSFHDPRDFYRTDTLFRSANWSLENYRQALVLMPFFKYLWNSFVVCAGTVVGQLLFCAMAAYSITKLNVRFKGAVLFLFLTTLMIPVEVLIIPLYVLMRDFPFAGHAPGLNLLNTYTALILPNLFSAFGVFLLRDFFREIPNEVLYAARVDGCGEMRVFFGFVLPLAKPALGILGVLIFIQTWNNFFWPLVALSDPDFYPLVLGLQRLIETGEPWNVVVAALVLGTVPSVILLVFCQRLLLRGIAYTGVYG